VVIVRARALADTGLAGLLDPDLAPAHTGIGLALDPVIDPADILARRLGRPVVTSTGADRIADPARAPRLLRVVPTLGTGGGPNLPLLPRIPSGIAARCSSCSWRPV
jgi:hypothetical protein